MRKFRRLKASCSDAIRLRIVAQPSKWTTVRKPKAMREGPQRGKQLAVRSKLYFMALEVWKLQAGLLPEHRLTGKQPP